MSLLVEVSVRIGGGGYDDPICESVQAVRVPLGRDTPSNEALADAQVRAEELMDGVRGEMRRQVAETVEAGSIE